MYTLEHVQTLFPHVAKLTEVPPGKRVVEIVEVEEVPGDWMSDPRDTMPTVIIHQIRLAPYQYGDGPIVYGAPWGDTFYYSAR